MNAAVAAAISGCMLLCGCSGSRPSVSASAAQANATPSLPQPPSPVVDTENVAPLVKISGDRAMQYTREIVAFGPRWLNNPAHHRVERYILDHLKGVDVEQDKFIAQTAEGPLPMNNIIARFPGSKKGVIVLASHYETNYPLRNSRFIGANDGASTSGLLLEIADKLRGKRFDGCSIWLVWDDGEEATRTWTDEDSLYGTKHLAQKWQQDGTARTIKALMVLDMIGYKDLDILRETNSTPWLEDLIYQAASKFGYQSHFFNIRGAEQDDHLPFARIGVPVADLMIGPYGYNDSYHHTTEDTLDKLSSRSLQIVGDTVMESIALLNRR